MTRLGVWILATAAMLACFAPWLAVHPPDQQHRAFVFAPPMPPRVQLINGPWRGPFYYPIALENPALRTFVEDGGAPTPLAFGRGGRLVSGEEARPWFPLGTDSLGRDVWSRLVFGARTSLGVAAAATLGALALGVLLGGLAVAAGGWFDEGVMRLSDLILVLPILYIVLGLRAAMPLVLPPTTLFMLLVAVLSIAGAPIVARGVRGILTAERGRDYVTAARALGATRWRVVMRHLMPATHGFLVTQALLLGPAFILAETTLSFVGLGFAPPTASWGSMLQEGTNIRSLADFPWVLAPAVAITVVVFGLTLASEPRVEHARLPRA